MAMSRPVPRGTPPPHPPPATLSHTTTTLPREAQLPHLCPIFSLFFPRAISAICCDANCTYASPVVLPCGSCSSVIPLGTISIPVCTQPNTRSASDSGTHIQQGPICVAWYNYYKPVTALHTESTAYVFVFLIMKNKNTLDIQDQKNIEEFLPLTTANQFESRVQMSWWHTFWSIGPVLQLR